MKPLVRRTDNAGMTALATVYCGWAITKFPDFVDRDELVTHASVAAEFLYGKVVDPKELSAAVNYSYNLMGRINQEMDAIWGDENV